MSGVSMVNGHIDNTEHCVCCGSQIPEGRQYCVICGYKVGETKPDLVEVVRCKDCKHWEVFMLTDKSRNYGCCKHTYDRFSEETSRHRHKTDFCRYGERKESEVQGE